MGDLRVVQPARASQPEQMRDQLARFLRALADVVESGERWQPHATEELTYEPPVAAVLALIDVHGEPAPIVVGLDALESASRNEVISDAADAMSRMPWCDRERVRAWWEAQEFERVKRRQREEQDRLDHPFVCGCSRRFATERGLAVHLRSCRSPRREAR